MDVAGASIAMANQRYAAGAESSLVRKALDVEGAAVTQLIDALPVATPGPIGSLGNNIDVRA